MAMPNFKLNVRTPVGALADAQGFNAPDLDAAMDEARESARELWTEGARKGEDRSEWVIEILDAHGRVARSCVFKTMVSGAKA
jgi:hypothetical protein